MLSACVAVFGWELMHAANGSLGGFICHFGLVPADLQHGRHIRTVVTPMFLHGGFGHIFGNLAYLYIFGDDIEDRIGARRFLV